MDAWCHSRFFIFSPSLVYASHIQVRRELECWCHVYTHLCVLFLNSAIGSLSCNIVKWRQKKKTKFKEKVTLKADHMMQMNETMLLGFHPPMSVICQKKMFRVAFRSSYSIRIKIIIVQKKDIFLRLNWLRVQNGFHFETFKQTINFYCVACFVHKWFLLFTFDKVIKEIFMPKRIAW